MQKLTLQNIIGLDNLPGFPSAEEFQLGRYLQEVHVRPSVADVSLLPATGNETGDLRFVLAQRSIYFYEDGQWLPISANGEFAGEGSGTDPSITDGQTTVGLSTGQLCYISGANSWQPARADGTFQQAVPSGIFTGISGKLFTPGASVQAAPFTLDGGKPNPGSVCFLAVGAADGGTAQGKLSAIPPTDAGHWVVACGTVIDAANYDASKTCKVLFFPNAPIQLS
jgi:hypothetical protein